MGSVSAEDVEDESESFVSDEEDNGNDDAASIILEAYFKVIRSVSPLFACSFVR